MTARRARGEEGATLLLALVFLLLFGLVIAALLVEAGTDLKTTSVVAGRNATLYATDGGIDYGIRNLGDDVDTALCPHADGSTQQIGTVTLNGQAVNVTCKTLSGDAIGVPAGVGGSGQFGPSGYTVVATGYVDPTNPPQWKHKGGGDCSATMLPQTDRGSMIQVFLCPAKGGTAASTSGFHRTVSDAHITSGSTTLTSATAHFTTGDVGTAITGTGIPAGTTVAVAVNVTTITMSKAATTTTTTGTLSVTAEDSGQKVVYGGSHVFNAGGFYLPYSNNVSVQGALTQSDSAYCTRDKAFAHYPPANNTVNPVVGSSWVCGGSIPDPQPKVDIPTTTNPTPTGTTTCHDGATIVSYKYPGVYTSNPNPVANTFLASGVYYFLTSGETAFNTTIWGGEPSQDDQTLYDNLSARGQLPGIDVWGNFVPYPAGCQRAIADGHTTAGATTLTSATAGFNASDVNSKITGDGIAFGTYITNVSGAAAPRSVNATVANTKTTFVVSAPGALTQADVGAAVTWGGGPGNPLAANTTIASVTDATHATLSQPATGNQNAKPFTITPPAGTITATLSQPATATSTTASLTILNAFSDPAANTACGGCMNSYNANPGKGVTFILGGQTIFDIHNGTFELFSRSPGTMDPHATQGTTMFAMGTTNPPAGEIFGNYTPSLTWNAGNGGDRCNCAFVTDKSSQQIIFHGLTYTPYQPIDVFSNAGTNYSPFFGGVVANWIVTHIDSNSTSQLFAGQFGAIGTPPSDRTIVVTATVPGTNGSPNRNSVAVIVVHVDGSPPLIKSWRNQ